MPLLSPVHVFILAFIIQCTTTAFADNASRDDLTGLQQEIKQLQYELNKQEQDKSATEKDLRTLDKQISETLKTLREGNIMLEKLNASLKTLQQEETLHLANLKKQQEHLRSLIRQQYKQGTSPQLKLLLNQDDPVLFGRALIYNRYLGQAFSEAITSVQQNIETLDKTKEQIKQQKNHLKQAQIQHTEKQEKLEKKREQRKKLLSQQQRDIQQKGQQLNTLLENEKRLKQTLEKLQKRAPAKPARTSKKKPFKFSKQKRSLPWPTRGKVKRRFGSQKGAGSLKWQGIVIATAPEQDVKSIAPGHVVFSDWLRGFGMLIIIDHGQGYISLYGQNETLFKEVGQSVEQNEVISSVGEDQSSGLYFELRHKGKPINPIPWFKK